MERFLDFWDSQTEFLVQGMPPCGMQKLAAAVKKSELFLGQGSAYMIENMCCSMEAAVLNTYAGKQNYNFYMMQKAQHWQRNVFFCICANGQGRKQKKAL